MNVEVGGIVSKEKYDSRNLVRCRCGKHWYPSKKMFVEFLKNYEDVVADVQIWSVEDWSTGECTIHLELKYKVGDVPSV